MESSQRPSKRLSEQTVSTKGIIHKIVFYNRDNNYLVARFVEEGKHEPITVVGCVPGAVEGQHAVITGKWEYNPKFGAQVHIRSYQECAPSSKNGIERFLGSGLIQGIGPRNRSIPFFDDEAHS